MRCLTFFQAGSELLTTTPAVMVFLLGPLVSAKTRAWNSISFPVRARHIAGSSKAPSVSCVVVGICHIVSPILHCCSSFSLNLPGLEIHRSMK